MYFTAAVQQHSFFQQSFFITVMKSFCVLPFFPSVFYYSLVLGMDIFCLKGQIRFSNQNVGGKQRCEESQEQKSEWDTVLV